jgi:hypothetical protein
MTMTTSAEILDFLEQRAQKFEFPVLDNANAHFIAGRFRGLRRGDDWGLMFELLVFASQERAIVTDVYAYGPLIGGDDWSLIQVGGIDEAKETPLWDKNGNWVATPGLRLISVGGKEIKVSCGLHLIGAIGLEAGDCLNEIRFTKAVVERIGLEKLVPEHVVFDQLPGFAVAEQLFSLTNWDHPDVAAGESPRESAAIVAAAKVVSGEAKSLAYDHSRDNLDAEKWTEDI